LDGREKGEGKKRKGWKGREGQIEREREGGQKESDGYAWQQSCWAHSSICMYK